ncbi:hypothetical protein Y032_0023g742 [Ancylostoma ceylanicum]|uniref:SCP domain-containing protein n=1 Tax=Ancylostoma ceylanicum TaxID=53326 RepID=A0A016UWL3_9BILA|nr:hypothetical protein Y032_0023g742 [Ancylostoma ceylanicum]
MIAWWYAFILLVSIVSLSRSIVKIPDCSQLRPYNMRPDMRDDLAGKVLIRAPNRGVSASMAYLCALEGMAGLILEKLEKPLTCPNSLGMYSLIFELTNITRFSDASADVDFTEKLTSAAIEHWKEHIPRVTFATSFGCNYRKEHGKHKFLCLLK